MTIAAGLVGNGWILLCADSLYTNGQTKQYGPKIFSWSGTGITVCWALAGNATISKMAADDCAAALHALNGNNQSFAEVFDSIRAVVRYVQHEYVDKVPLEERHTSKFSMLVALYTKNSGYRLYVSHDAALAPVHTYDCIGNGRELGIYIIEPSYRGDLTIEEASVLLVSAMAAAKQRVDGVGGNLQLIKIQSEAVSPILRLDSETMETQALDYSQNCAKLLLAIGANLSDSDFEAKLDVFTDQARWYRSILRGAQFTYLKEWLAKQEVLQTNLLIQPGEKN